MQLLKLFKFLPLYLFLLLLFNPDILAKNPEKLYGIKIYFNNSEIQSVYKNNYQKIIFEAKETGFNVLFTTAYEGKESFYQSSILNWKNKSIDLKNIRKMAKENGLKFAAICQVFFDPDYADERPDLIPVDSKGNNKYVNWQKMVCPSDSKYRSYKLNIIKEVLEELKPDIISLDFIRYPSTWEMYKIKDNQDSLREFCYCKRCLMKFTKTMGIKIPRNLKVLQDTSSWINKNYHLEWTKFKCRLITDFIKNVKVLLKSYENVKLAVHILPWKTEVFNNALIEIAAQDIGNIARYSDYLSPMIYHKLIGAEPEYISGIVNEMSGKIKKKIILPGLQIQKIGNEEKIAGSEFKSVLENALKEPSGGFVLYNWNNLLNPEGESIKKIIHDIISEAGKN
jgi:hypothetical protein